MGSCSSCADALPVLHRLRRVRRTWLLPGVRNTHTHNAYVEVYACMAHACAPLASACATRKKLECSYARRHARAHTAHDAEMWWAELKHTQKHHVYRRALHYSSQQRHIRRVRLRRKCIKTICDHDTYERRVPVDSSGTLLTEGDASAPLSTHVPHAVRMSRTSAPLWSGERRVRSAKSGVRWLYLDEKKSA